jgi:hypothetical protein
VRAQLDRRHGGARSGASPSGERPRRMGDGAERLRRAAAVQGGTGRTAGAGAARREQRERGWRREPAQAWSRLEHAGRGKVEVSGRGSWRGAHLRERAVQGAGPGSARMWSGTAKADAERAQEALGRAAAGASAAEQERPGRAAPEWKRRPQQARARVEQSAGGSRRHA